MTAKTQHVTFISNDTFRIYVFHETDGESYFVSYPMHMLKYPIGGDKLTMYIGKFKKECPFHGIFSLPEMYNSQTHISTTHTIRSQDDITAITKDILAHAERTEDLEGQKLLLTLCETLIQVQEDMCRGDIVLPEYNPELRKGAIDA